MYLKLGETASVFYDSTSKLLIAGKDEVIEYKGQLTKKIRVALSNGHIVKTEPKKVEVEDEKPDEKPLDKMTKKELVTYFKENYEVTEEELAEFSKKSQKEMVEYLSE